MGTDADVVHERLERLNNFRTIYEKFTHAASDSV